MNDRYSLTGERPSLFHVYSFVKKGVPGMALTLNYSSARRVLAPFVDVQGHCCYSSFHGLLRPVDAFWGASAALTPAEIKNAIAKKEDILFIIFLLFGFKEEIIIV